MAILSICLFSGARDQKLPRAPSGGIEFIPLVADSASRPAQAIRDGFQAAKGDWIAFVSPAEVLDVARLKSQASSLPDGSNLKVFVCQRQGSDEPTDRTVCPGSDLSGQDLGRLLNGLEGKIYSRAAGLAALATIPSDLNDAPLLAFALNGAILRTSDCEIAFTPAWIATPARGTEGDRNPVATIPAPSPFPSPQALEFVVDTAKALQTERGIAASSFFAVKMRVLELLRRDKAYDPESAARIEKKLSETIRFELRRIVMLTHDLSLIGGIPSRTRKTLSGAAGRDVDYVGISLKNSFGRTVPNNIVWSEDQERVLNALGSWSPADTVIVFPNNVLRLLSPSLRAAVDRFPLIFIGSGQLTFLMQDSSVLADTDYTQSLKVAKIIVFSRMDQAVYDQFGIYNHERGFHPVEVRAANTYSPAKNKHVAYVGRIDFSTKGADRLLEAVTALRRAGRGPLHIFTVSDPGNSPKLKQFMHLLTKHGALDDVKITLDETNQERIFDEISVLLVPSRKEAFPNVVLEAYSFGVPVIGMAHAPGPADLIDEGNTGFLLKSFSAENIERIVSSLTADELQRLSQNAFERHKEYGLDRYYAFIERIGNDTVNEFRGTNEQPVYPDLKPIRTLHQKVTELEQELASMRQMLNWAQRGWHSTRKFFSRSVAR